MPRRKANANGVGARLAEIRKHRGLTQAKLARAIGLTTGAIQAYERGRARVAAEHLMELARALHCDPADLLAAPGMQLPFYRYIHWRRDRPGGQ